MQRYMGLIQKLLEWVEEHGNGEPIDVPRLCDHEPKVVHYHAGLCDEAGYLHVQKISGSEEPYARYAVGQLTWNGHEALARFRQKGC